MIIAAGLITDMNTELNMGAMMPIFNSIGPRQEAATGTSGEGISVQDFETVLFQVLQQNMARLLENDQEENATGSATSKEDLLTLLEKILPIDGAASGALLSGLPLSQVVRYMNGLHEAFERMHTAADGSGILMGELKELHSALGVGPQTGDVIKDGINEHVSHSGEAKTLTENEIFIVEYMKSPEEHIIQKESVHPELQATLRTTGLSDQNLTTRQSQTAGPTTNGIDGEDDKASKTGQNRSALFIDARNISSPTASEDAEQQAISAELFKTAKHPGRGVNTSLNVANMPNEIAIDPETPSPQPTNTPAMPLTEHSRGLDQRAEFTDFQNDELISVTERASNKNDQSRPLELKEALRVFAGPISSGANAVQKEGISFKEKVQEIAHLQNPLTAGRLEETSAISGHVEGEQEDGIKKLSDKPDAHHLEKKLASLSNEVQRQAVTGKSTVPIAEGSGLIDKIKTESGHKSSLTEKNLESHFSTPAASPALNSGKITVNDISPAQMIERISSQFNEELASEGGRIKITLTPPSLGTLEMDVAVRNGVVKVMLIAENKEVQQMLSGNLDALKGSLQNQGLVIERCDVMMQDRRETYSQGFSQQQAFHDEQATRHREDEPLGIRSDHEESIPMIIKPMNVSMGIPGKISLFV